MTRLKRQILFFAILTAFPLFKGHCQNYWKDLCTPGYGGGAPAEFGGGMSILHQSNLSKPLIGLHLKLRVDNDEEKIFGIFGKGFRTFYYLGVNYHFRQSKNMEGSFRGMPKNTSMFDPIDVPFQFTENVSYLMFDFGADYYLHTNKKETFSFYSGWLLGTNTPFYKYKYIISAYDTINFILQTGPDWNENGGVSKTNLKVGINLGFCVYVGVFGSIYIETSPLINLFSEKDKDLPPHFTINSRYFLTFNSGYRYEF